MRGLAAECPTREGGRKLVRGMMKHLIHGSEHSLIYQMQGGMDAGANNSVHVCLQSSDKCPKLTCKLQVSKGDMARFSVQPLNPVGIPSLCKQTAAFFPPRPVTLLSHSHLDTRFGVNWVAPIQHHWVPTVTSYHPMTEV
jgi:hypothetical protein